MIISKIIDSIIQRVINLCKYFYIEESRRRFINIELKINEIIDESNIKFRVF